MVSYRLAEESDYENINLFHNRIYNTHRSMEMFLWEFHNCPHGKSIYVIAEDEGKIVGTNCVIPINLIDSKQQIIKSGKSEDTLVDPEYRGQKIFYHIYEFLFEKCKEAKVQVIWGFTSAKKPFKNLGFEVPFDHEQSLAVKDIRKSYSYLSSLNSQNKPADKIKIFGLCLLSRTKFLAKQNSKKLAYRIEKDQKIVSGVDQLILDSQLKSDSLFAIHQTKEFQDWRIYKNPNFHKVHTYSAYKDNDLVALIVFNSHVNQVAYVCQSTFHNVLSEIDKVQILRSVTRMLFDEGIVLIRNWHFQTNRATIEEATIFKRAGYSYVDRGIGLVWKKLDEIDIVPQMLHLSRIATQGTI